MRGRQARRRDRPPVAGVHVRVGTAQRGLVGERVQVLRRQGWREECSGGRRVRGQVPKDGGCRGPRRRRVLDRGYRRPGGGRTGDRAGGQRRRHRRQRRAGRHLSIVRRHAALRSRGAVRHLIEDRRQVLLQSGVIQIEDRAVRSTVAARRADGRAGQ